MTQRVRYHCVKHGQFFADVVCGRDHGPAPDRIVCPSCGQSARRRRSRKTNRKTNRGHVSLSAKTFTQLKAYCAGNGLEMSALIKTLTKDIP